MSQDDGINFLNSEDVDKHSSIGTVHEILYVGNSARMQARKSTSTHHSDCESAKDSDGLQNGTGANQKSPKTNKCMVFPKEVDWTADHWSKFFT